MALHIEFFGVARLRTGCASCSVELGDGTTLGDLLAALAGRFPDLARDCFDRVTDGFQLKSAYTMNLNGRFVRDASHSVADGDEVLLLATDAGG